MVQYGFCGGAAKPANTFYLFWQWAWPEGCRILRTPAPRAGREDTAGAAGHTAAGPSRSRGGRWSCPCLQPLQPPCLHCSPCLSQPQGVQAGAWLCKEGGQLVLSSPHSEAGFGVTQLLPSHARSPRPRGLSPSSLSPPAAEAEHIPIPLGSCTPIPAHPPRSGARPRLKPTRGTGRGSATAALNLGVAEVGGQAEAGWGKAERRRSGRGKGTVTWKQPDNGRRPHRENKAAGEPGRRSRCWPGG